MGSVKMSHLWESEWVGGWVSGWVSEWANERATSILYLHTTNANPYYGTQENITLKISIEHLIQSDGSRATELIWRAPFHFVRTCPYPTPHGYMLTWIAASRRCPRFPRPILMSRSLAMHWVGVQLFGLGSYTLRVYFWPSRGIIPARGLEHIRTL